MAGGGSPSSAVPAASAWVRRVSVPTCTSVRVPRPWAASAKVVRPPNSAAQGGKPALLRCFGATPSTAWSGSQLCPHPRQVRRLRGLWTVPQRLLRVRGFRRRRTALSEGRRPFGQAGVRGSAAAATGPNQVPTSARPTVSTRSSRASNGARG
jgi:hypothetical protein